MSLEKKPSQYSEHSTIGSAEELDAYGVWVKSEPQDLTSGLAGVVDFDTEAIPFDDDFATDFGTEYADLAAANADFEALQDFPDIDEEEAGSFDAGDEASTTLLKKIASELSSIRSELGTLKKEFADIRAESASGKKSGTPHDDFFDDEDDDEKIALTGDEMEDFLTTTDFTDGDEWPSEEPEYDAQREADEAALKKLSQQNEATAPEEIEIDFANLGIDLNNTEEESPDQDAFPPLEDVASFFDDIDSFSTEEMAELIPQNPLEDTEELQELRLEGADPLTPAPDNSEYLEGDTFDQDDSGNAGIPDDLLSADPAFTADAGDLNFSDVGFDLNLDDFSDDDSALLDDEAVDEAPFADDALDLSEVVIDEPDLGTGITEAPPEEAALDEISFEDDDISFAMDDFGSGMDLDDDPADGFALHDFDTENAYAPDSNSADAGLAQVIPEGFEINAKEAAAPFDDDLEALTEDEFSSEEVDIDLSEAPPVKIAKSDEINIAEDASVPPGIKTDLKNVLSYMDHLLESLPEDKIDEFAQSEYFDTYKKIFKELGMV